MAGSRDPEIKLFGKTIQIPVGVVSEAIGEEIAGDDDKAPSNTEACPEPTFKDEKASKFTEKEKNDEPNMPTNEERIDSNSSPENMKADEEQNEENSNPGDKSNKKPDKILPCPRCNSMDTKFCYYNNYNVNQPRHFCKNCQRYWTAGGSMRNVPVGAGRRKSKSSACNHQYPHITIPESIHHLPPLQSNGTVLSFGSDAPLCESMDSVLNVVEEQLNEEENRSTNSNWHGIPQNVPYFNGTPWPYPYGPPPFAFPLYPMAAYWSMPWLLPQLSSSPSSGFSETLGKRSREGNLLNQTNSDMGNSPNPKKGIWIPKTMRVDDPENAAKCSLWETMGFNNDKVSAGGGLFKAFQSNGNSKVHEVSQALLANPAALSRSFNFQERA